jgi:beta-ring hydroxylase
LWENPEDFNPERWPLDQPAPTEVNQDYRYLPFGGGQRKCLGDMFATFETMTALAMLVRRFSFKLTVGAPPVGMTTGATIHTTAGLHMTVTRRSHPLVTEEATLTNIEDDDFVKEYQSL